MSKVNNSFHNICIVHDVFGGRVDDTLFQFLIQKREDIFTVDGEGNITHIADHAIHHQTVNATEGGKVIATETFYDAVQLNLEDYLTPDQIRLLNKLKESEEKLKHLKELRDLLNTEV
jgi:hypothetical protein